MSYEERYGDLDEIPKEDFIKWILQLLDTNFDHLSASEIQEIEEACVWFGPSGLNSNKLKTLLPLVRDGFEEFVPKSPITHSRTSKKINKGIEILSLLGQMKLPIEGGVLSLNKFEDSGKLKLNKLFMSTTQSMFFEDIISALEVCGLQLVRCMRCQKIFFKNKRQEYCSKSCSNVIRRKKYYAKHAERLKAERRKSYAEQIKKE